MNLTVFFFFKWVTVGVLISFNSILDIKTDCYPDVGAVTFNFGVKSNVALIIMKIFQRLQELLTFTVSRAKIPYLSLKRNSITILKVFGAIILLMFLSFEAEAFAEFSEGTYAFTTTIISAAFVQIFHWNETEIFQLIDNFENTIKKRKLNVRKNKHKIHFHGNPPA